MCPVHSDTQIYALAEKARLKFVGQIGAKDHDLRMLVVHARLYDRLDTYVEERRRSSHKPITIPPNVKSPAPADHRNDSAVDDKERREGSTSMGTDNGEAWTVADVAAQCALIKDDVEYPSSTSQRLSTSVSVMELQDFLDDELDHTSHGSPTVTSSPAAPTSEGAPSHTIATSKAIISEIPIEDVYDSDSDSESDSDSNSDFDSDFEYSSDSSIDTDPPVDREGKTATPISISKHSSQCLNVKWNDQTASAFKTSDTPLDLVRDREALPVLERYGATSQNPEQPLSHTTPALDITSTKGRPLSPRVCDENSEESSSATYQTDGLSEGLRRILNPSQTDRQADSENRNAISRYLATLAFWGRNQQSVNAGYDIHDEIIV